MSCDVSHVGQVTDAALLRAISRVWQLVRVLAVAVAVIGVQIVRAWSAEPWRLPPVDRAFDGRAQFVDVAGAFAVPGRFHPVLNVSLYSKFLEKSTHKLTFVRHTSWGCLVQWV
jgi:hypothetical protein